MILILTQFDLDQRYFQRIHRSKMLNTIQKVNGYIPYLLTYADRTALNYKLFHFRRENLISLFQMTKHAHCRVMSISMVMHKKIDA